MPHGKNDYVYGLDIFRSVAILFVLMGHTFEHSSLPAWLAKFGSMGGLGVELFFVLSGFLIGGIIIRLIDQGQLRTVADIHAFWKRRWLRTLPLYVVIYFAFLRFDYHGRHDFLDYPQYLFFLQNFAWKIPEFFELSWSLAVEEYFYLLFPLALLACFRMTRNPFVSILLAMSLFVVVVYTYRYSHPLIGDWIEYQRIIRLAVLSRLDAVMFGVLMVALKRYRRPVFDSVRRLTPIGVLLFAIICVWYYFGSPEATTSRTIQVNLYTVQSIICCVLLPCFDGMKARPNTALGKFFVVTSRLSYSLYLVHILVIIFVNRFLAWTGIFESVYPYPVAIYTIYFTLYYLVAWASYSLIEKPFLRLRDEKFSWRDAARSTWPALGALAYLVVIA